MKNFIKKNELQLINGGYLSNLEENPVYNKEFVKLQEYADYIINFSKLAKTKDFVGKKADTLASLELEVKQLLSKNKTVEFVSRPESVKRSVTDKLKLEALSFMTFQENSSKVDKINEFLQQFKLLSEFEEFGLFFTEDIVKLNKIYTLEEIVNAVTETIDLLN
jgi:hypothetical protein